MISLRTAHALAAAIHAAGAALACLGHVVAGIVFIATASTLLIWSLERFRVLTQPRQESRR